MLKSKKTLSLIVVSIAKIDVVALGYVFFFASTITLQSGVKRDKFDITLESSGTFLHKKQVSRIKYQVKSVLLWFFKGQNFKA